MTALSEGMRTGASATRDDLERRYPGVAFGALVQILGLDNVAIGEGSLVGDGVWLNVCTPQSGARIVIGRRVQTGRHSNINSGGLVELGDHCLLGPRATISNADHVTADPMRPYMDQGAVLGGRTLIEENCWIGSGAAVLGSVTVGRGSVVGALAVVLADAPPMSVLVGNPARIVKLYDPVTKRWEAAATVEDRERVCANRERSPLPDRETYRAMLWEKAAKIPLDPVFAGGGRCL